MTRIKLIHTDFVLLYLDKSVSSALSVFKKGFENFQNFIVRLADL